MRTDDSSKGTSGFHRIKPVKLVPSLTILAVTLKKIPTVCKEKKLETSKKPNTFKLRNWRLLNALLYL